MRFEVDALAALPEGLSPVGSDRNEGQREREREREEEEEEEREM